MSTLQAIMFTWLATFITLGFAPLFIEMWISALKEIKKYREKDGLK